jgi:hypothetical protein
LTIAPPLKVHLARIIAELALPSLEEIIEGAPNLEIRHRSQDIRRIFVTAFIDALHQSTTVTNIRSGFRKSGMVPFNPVVPLNNKHMPEGQYPFLQQIRHIDTISSKCLTDFDELVVLEEKAPPYCYDDDGEVSLKHIIESTYHQDINLGYALSNLPDLFEQDHDWIYRTNMS